jgi:hypothetical protein
MTKAQARTSGIVAAILFAALVAWRLWSGEAKTIVEKKAPKHVHTITFTCDRTCTDTTQIPEVFPWKKWTSE